jgi:hypothetical protein
MQAAKQNRDAPGRASRYFFLWRGLSARNGGRAVCPTFFYRRVGVADGRGDGVIVAVGVIVGVAVKVGAVVALASAVGVNVAVGVAVGGGVGVMMTMPSARPSTRMFVPLRKRLLLSSRLKIEFCKRIPATALS